MLQKETTGFRQGDLEVTRLHLEGLMLLRRDSFRPHFGTKRFLKRRVELNFLSCPKSKSVAKDVNALECLILFGGCIDVVICEDWQNNFLSTVYFLYNLLHFGTTLHTWVPKIQTEFNEPHELFMYHVVFCL